MGLVDPVQVEGQVHQEGSEGHDEHCANLTTSSIVLFDPNATSPKVEDKVYKSQKESKDVS